MVRTSLRSSYSILSGAPLESISRMNSRGIITAPSTYLVGVFIITAWPSMTTTRVSSVKLYRLFLILSASFLWPAFQNLVALNILARS